VVPVAANQIAKDAGNAKAANMVALGAFLGASGLVDPQLVKNVLGETFAGRPKIVQLNDVCLTKGYEIGRTYAPALAGR
jgi:2-oxoglutarate ferredoxin oxidoreductase subunit gamma